MQLLSINYDENIILSWMKNSMQNAKQNFSTIKYFSSLSSLSEVVTGVRYVIIKSLSSCFKKKLKDQDLPNSLGKELSVPI